MIFAKTIIFFEGRESGKIHRYDVVCTYAHFLLGTVSQRGHCCPRKRIRGQAENDIVAVTRCPEDLGPLWSLP